VRFLIAVKCHSNNPLASVFLQETKEDIGAVLVPSVLEIHVELHMVLLPFALGSVKLTGKNLAGACQVDGESLTRECVVEGQVVRKGGSEKLHVIDLFGELALKNGGAQRRLGALELFWLPRSSTE